MENTAEIVGTGRLARALCAWLPRAGWRVATLAGRDARRARRLARAWGAGRGAALPEFNAGARVLFLAVPDDALGGVAAGLARGATDWRGKVVLHGSGVRDATVLAPLRARGAAVGGLHPLMTLPAPRPGAVSAVAPNPRGLLFAIESGGPAADTAAARLAGGWVRAWGGVALRLRADQKPLYHLAASLASPGALSLLALATETLRRSGLDRRQAARAAAGLRRLMLATISNAGAAREDGPRSGVTARALARAWTGPIARGDVATVRSHLAVAGPAAEAYRALALAALRLLPAPHRSRMRRLLRQDDAG